MHSWSAPEVPTLPGKGMQVRLFDSRDRVVTATSPTDVATMYVCGITPYDSAHLGHAATYVAFDLLARAWMDAGHDVHYVQNVTDIDDPLLVRAAETGVDWAELAAQEINTFFDDMAALRLVPPREYVGAVESIPLVVEYIEALQKADAVYSVDGDLYFRVSADHEFGSLSHLSRDEMLATFGERGGDPDREGKEDPLDCLLWLQARPGEPSWDSPLGPGRPGWHIECVAIAVNLLGMPFDVQGGGRDLIFPHHEMGASEAHIACGRRPYARHYVHAGMVGLHGEKMSKSLGNLVFVHRLRADGTDPMAIRLAILSQHYRSDWEWTPAILQAAEARLDLWRQAAALTSGPKAEVLLRRVRSSLSDDLDAPTALFAVDAWCGAAIRHIEDSELAATDKDERSPALMRGIVDALLGIAL